MVISPPHTHTQVKFYSIERGNHLTWGSLISKIEIEANGEFAMTASNGVLELLAPAEVNFF